jgi:tungstate transport system substrate-binding protein
MFAIGSRRLPRLALAFSLLVAVATGSSDGALAEERELLLATTTSVRDSGLLDALLPAFRGRTGIEVRVIAVGSGAALRMGAEGNADAVLTHAPEAEAALVQEGLLLGRRPFMESPFVIVGPAEDPAGVAGASSAAQALQHIRAGGMTFVSRADDSGTHRRERSLWEAAGLEPPSRGDRYVRTGAGMGVTLQVAGERRAYTLSDLGTFLAFQDRVGLVAFPVRDPRLRNVYAVLRVNPERFAAGRIRATAAAELEAFLLGEEARETIARFGTQRYGRPLFRPLAPSPAVLDPAVPED